MTDAAVNQQSKRLAGLSITNSSGAKVSILNDSPLDLDKASIYDEMQHQQHHHHSHPRQQHPHPEPPQLPQQGARPHPGHPEYGLPPARSPRSPHFRDHRHGSRDYFGIEDRRDPYYPPSIHSSSSSSHRYRSESYEAGRSTSLTNAATPFRSGFDSLRGADPANSQRSRSLSSGAQLYPYNANGHPGSSSSSSAAGYTPKGGATPMPFFMRAFSEDSTSDDHDPYRGFIGHPGLPEGLIVGSSFSKRKYSCTYPGCNKRFTTSGHLARHNRIHTGERNFSCLMPGCPSKFSRQDNMMQHYRTHISPKSRRGVSKKQDQADAESPSETAESEPVDYPSTPQQGQSPSSALPPTGLSRQSSRHSSPPRFYASERHDQSEDMDHDDDSRPSSRQTHHLPGQSQGSAASSEQNHRSSTWSVPASPTSPMTQVDRMDDGTSSTSSSSASSSRDQQLFYYRQQQQYQQQYPHQYQQRQLQKQQQQQAASHASAYYHAAQSHVSQQGHHHSHSHSHGHGHGHGHHGASKHLASPSSSSASSSEMHPHAYSYAHSQATSLSEGSHASGRQMNMSAMNMTPPSPQSTPVTPTKYRFDPIQDCLQQERRLREEATL
ncbi:hypothetical protein BGX28_001973 [Mortierella sp. GBA30]|nr:hypothetical protein BGX28_001973 [Mortierella sp. GBA30]